MVSTAPLAECTRLPTRLPLIKPISAVFNTKIIKAQSGGNVETQNLEQKINLKQSKSEGSAVTAGAALRCITVSIYASLLVAVQCPRNTYYQNKKKNYDQCRRQSRFIINYKNYNFFIVTDQLLMSVSALISEKIDSKAKTLVKCWYFEDKVILVLFGLVYENSGMRTNNWQTNL